jgi:hypothetical protein
MAVTALSKKLIDDRVWNTRCLSAQNQSVERQCGHEIGRDRESFPASRLRPFLRYLNGGPAT